MGLFDKIFGTRSQREIKHIQPLADQVLALEDEYKALSDEALKAKTPEFKERLAKGETLDDLLPPSGRQRTGCWECAPILCRFWAASFCIRAESRR